MAVITNDFKRTTLRKLFDDAQSNTNRYYIGVGKSEPWNDAETIPTPTGSIRDVRLARQGIQSIKTASAVSFVVTRYNWTSGTLYNSWDDADVTVGSNANYILTEDNRVYICVQEGRAANGTHNPSTSKPVHIFADKAFKYPDGYKWKYLYTVLATDATSFLSANFVPARLADSSETGVGAEQYAVQAAAVRGQVLGVKVINGGTGYGSVPTVTIEGDGTDSATATAFVTGGTVTHILIDSNADSCMVMGRGFNFAGVKITGGSPSSSATARAVIGDIFGAGLGADPRNDLRSTSLMFNTKPVGIESGAFFVGQDFRQVTLIQDPLDSAGAAITGTAFLGTKKLVTDNAAETGAFLNDTVITGSASGAKALFVAAADVNMYVVQNDSTGYASFHPSEDVTGTKTVGGTGTATLTNGILGYGGMHQPSGNIVYIDNRSAVIRDSDQTEDIKVVITI